MMLMLTNVIDSNVLKIVPLNMILNLMSIRIIPEQTVCLNARPGQYFRIVDACLINILSFIWQILGYGRMSLAQPAIILNLYVYLELKVHTAPKKGQKTNNPQPGSEPAAPPLREEEVEEPQTTLLSYYDVEKASESSS